jgi:hypothetical protein
MSDKFGVKHDNHSGSLRSKLLSEANTHHLSRFIGYHTRYRRAIFYLNKSIAYISEYDKKKSRNLEIRKFLLVQKSIHRLPDNDAQNAPDTADNKLTEYKSHEERNSFAMGF